VLLIGIFSNVHKRNSAARGGVREPIHQIEQTNEAHNPYLACVQKYEKGELSYCYRRLFCHLYHSDGEYHKKKNIRNHKKVYFLLYVQRLVVHLSQFPKYGINE